MNRSNKAYLVSIVKFWFSSCSNLALQKEYVTMDILALGNEWYTTILNSSNEASDVGNLVKAAVTCFHAYVGGSTNRNGTFQQFDFSEYIPDNSGKLHSPIN